MSDFIANWICQKCHKPNEIHNEDIGWVDTVTGFETEMDCVFCSTKHELLIKFMVYVENEKVVE